MRIRLALVVSVLAAFLLSGCGLFGDDEGGLFTGEITVGLTDSVPASGTYTLQNIYNPRVREILAIVQIENAKVGTEVVGKWYQMGVLQQKAPNVKADGALVSEASFKIERDSINANGRGAGRLALVPNAILPEDSYELRVYVDGKLARTQPFVVSNLVPGPAGTGGGTGGPAPTPVRTATPAATPPR